MNGINFAVGKNRIHGRSAACSILICTCILQMRQQQAALYQQQQVSQQGYGYGVQPQVGYGQPPIAANPFGAPYQAQPPAQPYNNNPFGNPTF
jgi:hypothetical protein